MNACPPLAVDRTRASLLRALRPLLGPHRLIAMESRPWASALFVGARHRLAIRLEGEQIEARAEHLSRILRDAELPIAGGFVADLDLEIAREDAELVLAIDALTIEEAGF